MEIIKLRTSFDDANVYLIDRSILVDAGMDGVSIISQLKELRLSVLKMIILTHCHYDHSAAAGEVAETTGAKIAIHRDDALLLNNTRSSAASLFGVNAPLFEPDILLEGGEVLGGFRVMHTPGHTPGGLCLYDPVSKVLFSGDTVFQDGSFGRTDLYGGNSKKLMESIKKLTELDVSIMYPGHGDAVVKDANEQIKLSFMMASNYL
jgi:glyoxylase-like metal-dependent hydrolase (beta-lactamase superfamily II)